MTRITLIKPSGEAITENIDDIGQLKEYMYDNSCQIMSNKIVSKDNRSYDKISMLKLVLLGQWNSLSDEELEYAVKVRLDFISFRTAPIC